MTPEIVWDVGTAYDFGMSLNVIHKPEKSNLRASWAAGVRSRLPTAEREVLQTFFDAFWFPMSVVYRLSGPKDAVTFLNELRQVPAAERLAFFISREFDIFAVGAVAIFREVAARGSWQDDDMAQLISLGARADKSELTAALDLWSRAEEVGDLLLLAMETYYSEFYAEEEKRLKPILEQSLAEAQALAETVSFETLLEALSQGITLERPFEKPYLVIAPCFWSTPLIVEEPLSETHDLFMYGAKPDDVSFVPGDMVPDELPQALKALADPTRLKILRTIAERPTSPADLARELRLRPPTVTHHLQILRFARLVSFTLSDNDRRVYMLRDAGLQRTVEMLYSFLRRNEME